MSDGPSIILKALSRDVVDDDDGNVVAIPGVPKKSVPKIKVFYKKSRSGIISKPYCPNTLESSDMIL